MDISIASFNSRGVEVTALHENKPRLIKNLLSSSTISLLQETHSTNIENNKTLQSILPTSNLFFVPGSGSAGGLCSAFPAGSASFPHYQSEFFVSVLVKNLLPIDLSAYIINVYVNPRRTNEGADRLCEYIRSLPKSENIIVMGDFNLDPKGRSSDGFSSLLGRLRDAGLRHIPTTQPSRFGGVGKNPSFIDHVFVRLASQFTTTLNLRPVTHSDHVALFLHISA